MTKNICYGIVSLLLSFFLAQVSYAEKIDKIIAFGDSMTDNGNIYKLTSDAHKIMPLIPIIPKNPPYYEGRFTNGPNWIDNLAAAMDVPVENYAYGGSWAEPLLDSRLHVPFGLDVQVAFYLVSSVLDFHKDRHLYVIWTGSNDYIGGRSDPEYATTNTVETIRNQMEWLIFYGAKNVFVLNVPNVGLTPKVTAKGKEFADQVTALTELHNKKLASMMHNEQRLYPKSNLILGDTTKHIEDIMINPGKYNLRNITDACYTGGFWMKDRLMDSVAVQAAKEANIDLENVPSLQEAYLVSEFASAGGQVCENPQEYLFWDRIHPSAAAHAIISEYALNRLNQNGIES